MVHRFAVCALVASALLTGCGGGSNAAKHGERVVLRPGPNGLDDARVTLPQTGPKHTPTKAEVQAATAKLRSWVNAHCPCELERTATEMRVLSEAHR